MSNLLLCLSCKYAKVINGITYSCGKDFDCNYEFGIPYCELKTSTEDENAQL